MIKRAINGLFSVYKLVISPLFGVSCRYAPTCSEYAQQALHVHGPIKGSWLSVKRICRCHPWGGHGFDPVPEATESNLDQSVAKNIKEQKNKTKD